MSRVLCGLSVRPGFLPPLLEVAQELGFFGNFGIFSSFSSENRTTLFVEKVLSLHVFLTYNVLPPHQPHGKMESLNRIECFNI